MWLMKSKKLYLLLACVVGIGWLFAASVLADHHHEEGKHIERESRHIEHSRERDAEGNETAGQIAAWLLVAANLTVAVSVLIKSANRYVPLPPETRNTLMQFNRFQKKHLMRFHYWLNPAAIGVALWHWASSRCAATPLPEVGLLVMLILIGIGVSLKFKIYPKPFKQSVFRIHTQPAVFLAVILVLAIGHLVAD